MHQICILKSIKPLFCTTTEWHCCGMQPKNADRQQQALRTLLLMSWWDKFHMWYLFMFWFPSPRAIISPPALQAHTHTCSDIISTWHVKYQVIMSGSVSRWYARAGSGWASVQGDMHTKAPGQTYPYMLLNLQRWLAIVYCTHSQSQRPSLGLPAWAWTLQLGLLPNCGSCWAQLTQQQSKTKQQEAETKGVRNVAKPTAWRRFVKPTNVWIVLIEGLLEDALLQLLGQLQPLLQLIVCRLHWQRAPGPPACMIIVLCYMVKMITVRTITVIIIITVIIVILSIIRMIRTIRTLSSSRWARYVQDRSCLSRAACLVHPHKAN